MLLSELKNVLFSKSSHQIIKLVYYSDSTLVTDIFDVLFDFINDADLDSSIVSRVSIDEKVIRICLEAPVYE